MRKALWFIFKSAIGGIISYVAPRALVAAGVPIDRWIVKAVSWLIPTITTEAALWGATLFIFVVLFSLVLWLDHRRHSTAKTIDSKPTLVATDSHGHKLTESQSLAEKNYPDLRLADSEIALGLFRGDERRKLIALFEGGHIKAWARLMAKGQTPFGEDTDLLVLKPDIWSKHRLEHMPKLQEGNRAQTFLKNDRGYSIYYDVWLNSLQLAGAFPLIKLQGFTNPQARRLPIKEFIEIAGKTGWNLNTNEILDLERGVQQDALFGDLKLWGRRNFQRLPILNVHEPLQEIPKDHWKDFRPQLLDAMDADKNIHARSWSREFGQGADHLTFLDLHIDGSTSIPWLTGNGLQYKGWTKKREQERNAQK